MNSFKGFWFACLVANDGSNCLHDVFDVLPKAMKNKNESSTLEHHLRHLKQLCDRV